MNIEYIDTLEESKLLSPISRNKLSKLASESTLKNLNRGNYLFTDGQKLESMYLIVKGRIKLVKYAANGKETILGVYGVGDTIGEMAAIDNRPATHSAVVMEPSTVYQIGLPAFRNLLRADPGLSLRLAAAFGQRLREAESRISGLASDRVDQRIAGLLLKLSRDQGNGKPAGVISLPYRRQDIADIVGTSVETCIRVLSAFERSGAIEKISRTRLRLDLAKLQAVSDLH